MSWGLIVLDSRTSTNNSFNTTAPINGAPWSNVAQQQRLVSGSPTIDSSAVYIGNGYILTANHTYGPNSVILDGVAYAVDTTFPAVSFTPIDLRLYKILNPPPLPVLAFPDSAESDLNRACTMIGWGKGKGDLVPNDGWKWGGTLLDDLTKAKRWGTNITIASTFALSYWNTYSYNAIYTTFDTTGNINTTGQTEASATMSDSGGALFQQFITGGPWKLSGILTLVSRDSENYPDGNTFYNQDYRTFAVRLKDVASKFRYRQWKESKGISPATSTEDDSDADGIGLLEEYAFGGDPEISSPGILPRVGTEGTDATLTYQLERTRTDLVIAVQESIDLVQWDTANVTSTSTVSDNGTIRTFKAKVPLNGAAKKFLRLHITTLTN